MLVPPSWGRSVRSGRHEVVSAPPPPPFAPNMVNSQPLRRVSHFSFNPSVLLSLIIEKRRIMKQSSSRICRCPPSR